MNHFNEQLARMSYEDALLFPGAEISCHGVVTKDPNCKMMSYYKSKPGLPTCGLQAMSDAEIRDIALHQDE